MFSFENNIQFFEKQNNFTFILKNSTFITLKNFMINNFKN